MSAERTFLRLDRSFANAESACPGPARSVRVSDPALLTREGRGRMSGVDHPLPTLFGFVWRALFLPVSAAPR
ncbi:MAG: hypothetical protein WBS54_00950 [Acidobacteriota bacterium]